jgi:hypothetical protein
MKYQLTDLFGSYTFDSLAETLYCLIDDQDYFKAGYRWQLICEPELSKFVAESEAEGIDLDAEFLGLYYSHVSGILSVTRDHQTQHFDISQPNKPNFEDFVVEALEKVRFLSKDIAA